ncbi:MAG: VanZ family protein [Halolamina sp.]
MTAVVVGTLLPGGSSPNLLPSGVDAMVHAVGFAAVAAALARAGGVGLADRRRLAGVVVAAAALGVALELLQGPVPGRTPSLADAVADLVGAVGGAVGWAARVDRPAAARRE